MKRFLVKMMTFFIITAVITIGINFVFMKRDTLDPDYVRKFQDIPDAITICNFGSSHGLYGFCYDDQKKYDCFNFALESQMLSYDLRLFDYYADNICEGAIVFIPVSYFSFYGEDERMGDIFLSKNKRYYKILPSNLIKDYDLKTDIYVRYLPALSADADILIETLFAGGVNSVNEEKWLQTAVGTDVQHDAELAVLRHVIKNKIDENGKRIINQEELESLECLINRCYQKGCTPVLVTTPFLKEYTDEVKKADPDFFENFYSLLDRVIDDTGVSYYDYGFDDRFSESYEKFLNADHLNKQGAKEFVDILMDEVVQ